ncbi:MAG: hypothetical protein HQL74_06465 [Magnetococcales bacterium]|nr:hypothetical protein [Magnetococcales bacterium]
MHHRLSYSLIIIFYLFILLTHFPVTSGVADTVPEPVEMKVDTFTPKKICHTDIMAQCRRITSRTKSNSFKTIEENYLTCLKDFIFNHINRNPNTVSAKSKKAFISKINKLIYHRKMFTLLYDDTGNPPNNEMVEERIAINRSRIAEEFLIMFFNINYGCNDKHYIYPDEELSNSVIEELNKY